MRQANTSFTLPLKSVQSAAISLALFISMYFVLGIQTSAAQTPGDLGPGLTQEVIESFDENISSIQQEANDQGNQYYKHLARYLSKVKTEFNNGNDLGKTFRKHGPALFNASSNKMSGSPAEGIGSSDLDNDEVREFNQLTEDIQLSQGDLSDLTDIFNFLVSLG